MNIKVKLIESLVTVDKEAIYEISIPTQVSEAYAETLTPFIPLIVNVEFRLFVYFLRINECIFDLEFIQKFNRFCQYSYSESAIRNGLANLVKIDKISKIDKKVYQLNQICFINNNLIIIE